MRHLVLCLALAACGSTGTAPQPNVTSVVTASGTPDLCDVALIAHADRHGSVFYYVLMTDRLNSTMLADTGYFNDSLRVGQRFSGFGTTLPWAIIWNFHNINDSLEHATIHTDCTAAMCGKVQSSC